MWGCGSRMSARSLLAALGHYRIPTGRMQVPNSKSYSQESWKNTKGLKGPGIPVPPGPFRVGCVDLACQLKGDARGSLLLRLHYPTSSEPGAFPYADWYPDKRYIQGYFEFEKKKFDPVVFTKITSPKIPAMERAPLISKEAMGQLAAPVLPVVLFCHGLGGMRTTNSAVCCDLASYGFMVASVEHRDGSACVSLQRVPASEGSEENYQDHWITHQHVQEGEKEFHLRNEQVKIRVDDANKSLVVLDELNEGKDIKNLMGGNFTFEQFKGRLDVVRTAIMGHSFGGGTTVLALAENSRFKCGLALDCWMFPIHKDFYRGGPSSCAPRPLYFINSYNFQWKQNVQNMMSLTTPPDSNGKAKCRVMTLRGTHHFNQCDLPFLAETTLERFGLQSSELDSTVAHRVNTDICLSFLRRHLLKDPSYQGIVPNLDGTEGHSEHILFGTNVDLTNQINSKI